MIRLSLLQVITLPITAAIGFYAGAFQFGNYSWHHPRCQKSAAVFVAIALIAEYNSSRRSGQQPLGRFIRSQLSFLIITTVCYEFAEANGAIWYFAVAESITDYLDSLWVYFWDGF